jgi:hypothetical protein
MKKFIWLLVFLSFSVLADDCKVTTVTIERNGQIQKDSATICTEGGIIRPKMKIGDIIMESEVGESRIKKYFMYNNNRCRLFQEETVINHKIRNYYGVICQADSTGNDWLIVDIW